MQKYYSNGKLLITAEYLVLNGAEALAVPTKFGQSLEVIKQPLSSELNKGRLLWKSIDNNNKTWFQTEFKLPDLEIKCIELEQKNQQKIALTLQKILLETKKLNPEFLSTKDSFFVTTKLDFKNNWGLGTSSTLINNIAKWANVNAFTLQLKVFGGSAYDIACAQNDKPVIYKLNNNKPEILKVNFNPDFKDNLFFVYLNQKKNSRKAIKHYKNKIKNIKSAVNSVNNITKKMIKPGLNLTEFEQLIIEHEQILSEILEIETIKNQFFKDYFGQIKSLGAWEGDFILATGNEKTPQYFKEKGYNTILKYVDMVK